MKSKGFTLLEVIAAIFILTVGTGSSFALIYQVLSATSQIENKLIASYLAQEGIEIVKNLRDTIWLNSELSWEDDLPESDSDMQADYSSDTLEIYSDSFLNIDSDGFYSYSSGDPTKFKRKISISDKDDEKMKVLVRIEWKERGRTHNFEVIEHITNWYEK